jgi:hypothetical protein
MYADDTVLFSENVQELQNMINVIKQQYNILPHRHLFLSKNICPLLFLTSR